ncbi:AzlC family ABC transporter permease [Thiopseudomonas alkaliphila]|uniref:AzlC family ABC transporter permease n=1 Tax=Thiopseudomonas alkaliphila TaxID=1697053 RepID=UPI00069DCCA8|nr:AzlC family ABC transporter permease [Thiopseudomonas alkaliphila]AKX52559.1 branched-chain amino acid ABC transporter permease [Thiopseudomonas alkaliphila]
MLSPESPQHTLTARSTWLGFQQLLPISLFVAAFGTAFGLAATQMGLSNNNILLMSAFVFAGASQFAVLELWGTQVSIIPVLVTVFAINARHLLMGATLYPWLKNLPPRQRYGSMLLVSDANWAFALQAFNQGRTGFGLLLGGGIALWLFWSLGTWLGIYFGNVITDPKVLGLDMVMGCFLLSMVIGGEKNLRMLIIWLVAGCTSLGAYYFLPENTHVVVGALAGGASGVLLAEARP